MLRDLLTGEVPLILRPGRLYATAAMGGAGVFLLLLHPIPAGAALAGMVTTAALRLLAIRYELTLPAVEIPPDVSAEHPTAAQHREPQPPAV